MHMHRPLESHKFYLFLHHPIHTGSHLYTQDRGDDRETICRRARTLVGEGGKSRSMCVGEIFEAQYAMEESGDV